MKDRVLAFSCPHAPAMHPHFVQFLEYTFRTYNCSRLVCLGDLLDHSAMSFHAKELDLPNTDSEIEAAQEQLHSSNLFKWFPEADFMIGNHDALPERQARERGVSPKFVKSVADVYGFPKGWTLHGRHEDLVIDGVIYRHGDKGKQSTAKNAALANAKEEFRSVVHGHLHTLFGVEHHANSKSRIFGLQVGAGHVPDSPYMRYSRVYSRRPILGCGIVEDGVFAQAIPMELDDWKAWAKN